jgi:hypothetical protein
MGRQRWRIIAAVERVNSREIGWYGLVGAVAAAAIAFLHYMA